MVPVLCSKYPNELGRGFLNRPRLRLTISRLNCLSRRRILLAARAFALCMLPASRSGCHPGGTLAPMPLGIEARSHAGQRRFGQQSQTGGPVPQSSPRRGSHGGRATSLRVLPICESRAWHLALPNGEGALSVVVRDVWRPRFVATRLIVLPLLWGEGWGGGTGLTPFPPCGVLSLTPSRPGPNS